MPVVKMGELAQTCAPAGLCHAGEAEIDPIGEDDGEQGIAIVGLPARTPMDEAFAEPGPGIDLKQNIGDLHARSEEHTSELQSLMRNSYAVFCLKKKNKAHNQKKLHII